MFTSRRWQFAVCVMACAAIAAPYALGTVLGSGLAYPFPFLRGDTSMAFRRGEPPPHAVHAVEGDRTPLSAHGISFDRVNFTAPPSRPPVTSWAFWAQYFATPGADGSRPTPLTLRAWLVQPRVAQESTGVCVIGVHGAGNDRRELLSHLPMWYNDGHTVLLMDVRERGLSDRDGLGVGYGFRERHDVRAAAAYLWDHPTAGCTAVVPIGMSAGGAAVLMSMATLEGEAPASDLFSGAASISTFASFQQLMHEKLEDYKLQQGEAHGRARGFLGGGVVSYVLPKLLSMVPAWLEDRVLDVALTRLGCHDSCVQPVDGVAAAEVPLFLAHGEHDGLIHFRHHQRLKQAAEASASPSVTTVLVPRGGHSAHHLITTSATYSAEMRQFLASFATTRAA